MKEMVVKLYKEGRIARVALEEKEGKNTFTPRFIRDLKICFEEINNSEDIHVVLVHGFDNYFCCGGTMDELLELYNGINEEYDTNFSEQHFYDVFLQCKVPVIAAMQGHAIGGGFSLACFADVLVMGEQCVYAANFMKYGFTPGMGATYIIPYKMGDTLAAEMMYSARTYFGSDLKARGINAIITDKEKVIATARGIAEDIALKPRISIIALKDTLVEEIRTSLPVAIEREIEQHKISFKQREVLENIHSLYKE